MYCTSEPRYAVYFVPDRETPLYRFGASVLGYDSYRGSASPLIDGADQDKWPVLVREPAVYGFHATIKAPVYLAGGKDEAGFIAAVTDFAARHTAVPIGELVPRELGAFIALVPQAFCAALDVLARTCVRDLDMYRTPMSEQERARRLTPGLSDRQIENLVRWGYPYVFDDFRFHMTLTGALSAHKRAKAFRFLCDKFQQTPGIAAVTIDQLVVAKQTNRSAPFQIIGTAPLAG
ncbi:MAG: DUF1045 domain-containing protein [Rhodopseudomonas sp.]|nr:DUF1045 domain-containing protein [Rhodopseudomonas sp.]